MVKLEALILESELMPVTRTSIHNGNGGVSVRMKEIKLCTDDVIIYAEKVRESIHY